MSKTSSARRPTRLEQQRKARRARARRHYDRVRERRAAPKLSRVSALLLFAMPGALGLAAAPSLRDALERFATDTPAPIESIEVQGHASLSGEEVARASGIGRGLPLAELDPRHVEARLEEHPWIREARVVALPSGSAGQVWLRIVEREPRALLRSGAPTEHDWRAVDETGAPFVALAPEQAPGLPRLTSAERFENGVDDARLAEAIALAERLPALGLASPAQLAVPAPGSAEGWVIQAQHARIAEPFEIVLGSDSLDERLERLAELLAAAPDALRNAASIDLRFADRAILRARQESAGDRTVSGHDAPRGAQRGFASTRVDDGGGTVLASR